MASNGPDAKTVQTLQDIANKLRIHSIQATSAANSGHPTSCCSAAEIVATLFFHTMHYDTKKPRDASSDRFVLSKGHAAPVLYAAWVEAGFVDEKDLLKLRQLGCDLEGHPTPRLEFVDVASGSLGQGISCAAGMAYTAKHFDKASYRTYCLLGDGESAEGSVWEAAHFASFHKLDNFVAIVDVNRLGQSDPTSLEHHVEIYEARFKSFGWNTVVVDGHSIPALIQAFSQAKTVVGKPTAVIAKTFKGKGIPDVEDKSDWHGKALGAITEKTIAHLKAQLKNPGPHGLLPPAPTKDAHDIKVDFAKVSLATPPSYKLGEKVATRLAYGTALVKLGKSCDRVIALDGDVKNSTYSEKFKKEFPERFIECFIAEQNMVGVAIGCGTRGRTIPFLSTFATFYSRAYDQIRMGAISQANIKCCGSHVGVSIGEDGPSQMGLEDIALFRSIPGCVVFYPGDAVSTERAVELAARVHGICFIRTGRPATPVIYENNEHFEIGKAKVVRQSNADRVLIISGGVTLIEALKAADILAAGGVNVAVLDPFTIKPLDVKTLVEQVKRVEAVLVVEDHYPEGGVGEAVSAALVEAGVCPKKYKHIAVRELPMSGTPDQLLEKFGLNAASITKAVMDILA